MEVLGRMVLKGLKKKPACTAKLPTVLLAYQHLRKEATFSEAGPQTLTLRQNLLQLR